MANTMNRPDGIDKPIPLTLVRLVLLAIWGAIIALIVESRISPTRQVPGTSLNAILAITVGSVISGLVIQRMGLSLVLLLLTASAALGYRAFVSSLRFSVMLPDIFNRLGTARAVACLGATLFLACVVRLIATRRRFITRATIAGILSCFYWRLGGLLLWLTPAEIFYGAIHTPSFIWQMVRSASYADFLTLFVLGLASTPPSMALLGHRSLRNGTPGVNPDHVVDSTNRNRSPST